jgi:hypothetical protein
MTNQFPRIKGKLAAAARTQLRNDAMRDANGNTEGRCG